MMSWLRSSRPVVLLVDDQPDVRLALRFVLETEDFHVVEAATGRDALTQMAVVKVDVVLTDIFMPGEVDGIGLLQEIATRRKPRPGVIVMSGAPNESYRSSLQVARYLGATVTLTKPIDADVLLRTVRSVLTPQIKNHGTHSAHYSA